MIVHDPQPHMPDLLQQCTSRRHSRSNPSLSQRMTSSADLTHESTRFASYDVSARNVSSRSSVCSAADVSSSSGRSSRQNVSTTRYETSFGIETNEPRTRIVSHPTLRHDARLATVTSIRDDPTAAAAQATRRTSGDVSKSSRVGLARETLTSSESSPPPRDMQASFRRRRSLHTAPPEARSPDSQCARGDIQPCVHGDALLSEIFSEDELRKLGFTVSSEAESRQCRYPPGGYRPRTCPLNGSYRSVNPLGNFIVTSLNDVPPPYRPPPRYVERSPPGGAGGGGAAQQQQRHTRSRVSSSSLNNDANSFATTRDSRSLRASDVTQPAPAAVGRRRRSGRSSDEVFIDGGADRSGAAGGSVLAESYLMAVNNDDESQFSPPSSKNSLRRNVTSQRSGKISRAVSSPSTSSSSENMLYFYVSCTCVCHMSDVM